MSDVYVTGIGMTKFGKSDRSLKSLLIEACREAMIDAGKPKIDAVYVGNFMGGSLGGQEILGSIIANELGLVGVPTAKVEGACASGGIAFRQAYLMVLNGVYDTVLVAGVEKMTHTTTEHVTNSINMAMDNDTNEGVSGLTFPAFFGVTANRYMHEYGAEKKHLAMVALKNREYARNNPNAQFQKQVTMDEIIGSRMITAPLGLFDCSPITDGAGAVVITRQAKGVSILASAQASGPTLLQEIPDILKISAIGKSARKAYEQAGIGPEDIDVVEVHDCFSMTELLAIEELGFFSPGEGWLAVEQGLTKHGGKIPVNTSGGLLSRGHPIGATGIAQIYQIVSQLRGTAANQVDNAKIGLAQNLGGTGAYSTVHLFAGKGVM